MATWNNSVPLGQAGTGASVVLGDSRAAKGFIDNLGSLREQQQKQRLAVQQQAQQIAKSYRDNALKAREGKLFADQLGQIEGDYINEGLGYVQKGQDIYDPMNPNYGSYAEKRREIEGLRAYAKSTEQQYNDILKNANKYDPEDLQGLNEFVKGDIRKLYSEGAQLPQVQERFNLDKALQGVRAATVFNNGQSINGKIVNETTINEPATKSAIISNILANPGGERYLNRITGGLPVNEVERLPNKKEDIKNNILADYDGDPALREALANAPTPIIKGTPAFDKWANEETDKLYKAKQGYNDVINKGMAAAGAGIRTGREVKDEITPYQQAQLNAKAIKDAEKKDSPSTYRQQLIEGIMNNDVKSFEKLQPYLPKGSKVEFKTSVPTKNSKGGYNLIRVNIPSRINSSGQVVQEIKEDISLSNPENAFNRLNFILGESTGEKVSPSKVNIEGGKPRGKQVDIKGEAKAPQKTIKSSDVAARARAAGYTTEEYRKLLISKGVKIQ